MKLYEYQAKQLFQQFKIKVPEGRVAVELKNVPVCLKNLKSGPWVVKAQVLAGGRGKAGGVKVGKTSKEANSVAKTLLGKTLVTHQTGPSGEKVQALLIEKTKNIAREIYFSILLDRKLNRPVIMASREGGMDIESLASQKPDAILKYSVDPLLGLSTYKAREIAQDLGLTGKALNEGTAIIHRLSQLFFKIDASLVEVNPLVLTLDEEVVALDGKISTDDNALFRHPDQQEWKEKTLQLPSERRAAKAKISFIKLDGNVGCLVNGAGLAMATMDIIKHHGGEPANFLDVGGGASSQQVTEAFKIILSDKQVRAILVNIFGGIMRCDIIAEGITTAANQTGLNVPLIVRLEGTKAKEGKEILSNSKLSIKAASSLTEAAKMAVEAAHSYGNSSR